MNMTLAARFVRRVSALAFCVAVPMAMSACQSVTFLTANLPAAFGSYDASRNIRYGALERQKLDVYSPEKLQNTRPIVIFIHGGGWTSGSKDDYRFVAEALTSRGFVAVIPNYRLHPQVKFPAFIDDVAQAVAWTHAHAKEYGGDANHLYLMGHSAGAQIAALVALNPAYLAKVNTNRSWIKGFIGLAGPYDFLPFDEAYLHDIFGPETQYPQSQPINFVDEHSVPTLLLHGEADRSVWPKNSRNLAAKLRANRVPVTERYYPGVSHSGVLAALSVYFRGRPVLDEITTFINETVRASVADTIEKGDGRTIGQSLGTY